MTRKVYYSPAVAVVYVGADGKDFAASLARPRPSLNKGDIVITDKRTAYNLVNKGFNHFDPVESIEIPDSDELQSENKLLKDEVSHLNEECERLKVQLANALEFLSCDDDMLTVDKLAPVDETVNPDEVPPVDETVNPDEVPPVDETMNTDEVPPVDETVNPDEVPPVDETVNPDEVPPVDETVNPDEVPPVDETMNTDEVPPVDETVNPDEVPPVDEPVAPKISRGKKTSLKPL